MTWEREPFWWKEDKTLWPVVAPKTGKVERYTPVPFKGTKQYRDLSFNDNFDSQKLKLAWNFRRVPKANSYSLSDREGYLRLFAKKGVIKERERASLVGFRQTATDFEYTAKMHFKPQSEHAESGVIIYQKDNNYISFTVQKANKGFQLKASHSKVGDNESVVIALNTINEIIIEQPYEDIFFRIVSKDKEYQLLYALDKPDNFQLFAKTKSDGVLSRKYTGANIGLYSTGNGKDINDFADFDWIKYQGLERK